jgi:hypothetical protein
VVRSLADGVALRNVKTEREPLVNVSSFSGRKHVYTFVHIKKLRDVEMKINERKLKDHKNKDVNRDPVQFPHGTRAHDFFFCNGSGTPKAKWQKLEQLLERQPKNQEEWLEMAFKNFVATASLVCPEDRERIQTLYPLILAIHHRDEELISDIYISKIRKLCENEGKL